MAQSTTPPRGSSAARHVGQQPPWLRGAGIGLGVIVATLAIIGLIYLGVDALIGRDDIAPVETARAVPADPNPAPPRFPDGEPAPAAFPEREPARPALTESAPRPAPRELPAPPPVREPPPTPRLRQEPEPARPPASQVPSIRQDTPAAVPPRTVLPEPRPPALSQPTEPVDLLVRVVDPEDAVLSRVALSLNSGARRSETNERGEWVFEGLVPGSYQLTATLEDYFPEDVTIEVAAGLGQETEHTETLTLKPTNRVALEAEAAARAEQAKIDIAATLEAYGKAYMDLDPEALLEVFPAAAIDGIREYFGGLKSYETYAFTPPKFTALDVEAGTATVEVAIQRKFEPKVGGPQEPDDLDYEFSLVKPPEVGRWLVAGFKPL